MSASNPKSGTITSHTTLWRQDATCRIPYCAPRGMNIPGSYRVTFAVMSENFPTTRATFDVVLDRSIDKTRLVISASPPGA
jgi:hypothetical protein